LLSDFSRSSLALERPVPAELAALGDRAKLYLAQPMAEQADVQIEAFRPRHHMVVTRGPSTQASVSMEVGLRRFADEMANRNTTIDLAVVGVDGQITHVAERSHRWSAGQNRTTFNVDIPIADLPINFADAAGGGASALAV